LLFVPTGEPFTCHWYTGDEPPLTGVAVKVTFVPAQIVVADGVTETLAGKIGLTVIAIPGLVAGFPVAQGAAFEVMITVTICPFVSPEVVNVLLFVPAFAPFTSH
jgi:hypothetical protein